MNRILALTLVFTTTAAVLVLEILAGRLLSPYLGLSLDVFTGIIGTLLAGIATGAWLGGRAADRTDPCVPSDFSFWSAALCHCSLRRSSTTWDRR